MKKVVVVLKMARLPIPQKVAKARFIVTSMTGNAFFTTPSPALAAITTSINALEAAYLAAAGGGVDDTAAMHSKEFLLEILLKSLAAYVEVTANANLVNAEAIALSSGMEIRHQNTLHPKGFSVKPTGDPGEVKLSTVYVDRSTNVFQMTTDASGATGWLTIGQGTKSSFTKNGLTSGARYYFRVASVGRDGQEPWSNIVNTIVL